MGIDISHRVYSTSGGLDRSRTLPAITGAGEHEPSFLDRIGEHVQGGWAPVAIGGSAIGAGLGATALGSLGSFGGIAKGIGGGVLGALGGAALIGAGLGLFGGNGKHDDVPEPAAASEPAHTDVAAAEDVKVMTFNLHGGMGGPGVYGSDDAKVDRIAEVIRAEDPDVVLLQEVDRDATRSSHVDLLAELDERLDPESSVGVSPSTTVFGRDQQNAVMTFNGFEVSDARNLVHQDARGGGPLVRGEALFRDIAGKAGDIVGQDWDPGENYQARNTIDTIVRTPGGTDVRVLGGHYEPLGEDHTHQEEQVGAVADAIGEWDGPTIYGADFNVVRSTPAGADERAIMAEAGMRDAFEGSTTPGVAGGIDRIYASDHVAVRGTRIVTSAGDTSDHLPVVADLRLRPAGD